VAAKKTSSVMSYCSLAPAVLWGKNPEVEKLCSRFGFCLGLAFQLIDDTFDFDSNSQKDTALDLQNGIVNSVVFEFLIANPSLYQKFLQKESLVNLVKDIDMSPYVEIISTEAQKHLEEAKKILLEIKTYLKNDYQNRESELDKKIEALEFIVDFMGMRSY
jgi:octaprenyl-diphosphate synthase